MNIIFDFIILLLFFIIIPVILGLPWQKVIGTREVMSTICGCYSLGSFIQQALFQVIAFSCAICRISFTKLAWYYTIELLIVCIISWMVAIKIKVVSIGRLCIMSEITKKIKSLTIYEWIYLTAFIGLFIMQIILAIRTSTTYMSVDDAWYVTWGADALEMDRQYIVDDVTGVASLLNIHRAMQSSIVYPAYLAKLTGLNITIIEHTIQSVFCVILAYCVYVYMADDLFEERENQYIFLLLISLLYVFGYYSNYSTTFRLLGPNWQGKAILAVSLTPWVFTFVRKLIDREYEFKSGMLLVILSIAATAYSLIGIGTFVAITYIPFLLSMLGKKRQVKHIIYLIMVSVFPIIYSGIYIFYRFMV